MSRVSRFEDLIAWQKAQELAVAIHGVVSVGPFARDFPFRDQLWRAALSIPSNIAEGYERFNAKEFAYFLSVAKASCAEVRSDLYIARNVGHIDVATMESLLVRAMEVARILGGLRASVTRRSGRRSAQHSAPSTQHRAG
jgi:four helix bundle protein